MMCDIRLIYLGNNKYGEIRCKPEILSLLPKLLTVKHKSLSLQHNLDHTAVSPRKDLVFGILDANQSSCTLLTLPSLPETSQIEHSKNEITLKPNVGTDGETSGPLIMETAGLKGEQPLVNSSMDIPSILSMDTPSFDTELITCKPDSDEQTSTNKEHISITDKTNAAEFGPEPKSVETVPASI